MSDFPQLDPQIADALADGCVIPAHPLALTADGEFDRRHQKALTRYYAAAGAGGVAVAVHTTQFEIRDADVGLLRPVLQCAAETLAEIERDGGRRIIRIAGVCGRTDQALAEASQARDLGYDIALLGLAAMGDADEDALIAHCERVAGVMPLMGFYLQPAVGGRRLSYDFWRRFAAIPNVVAIKVAPFNRYMTLDTVRGVAASGRADQVALYTGNDDNIVADLLTRYDVNVDGRAVSLRFVGGLLGHWAVWTRATVEMFNRVRSAAGDGPIPSELLTLGARITDMNAAVFDVANDFAGVIAGVQTVLTAQGLLASPRCLNGDEVLSPGQADEIHRVRAENPDLIDDAFIAEHLDEWLA